MTEPDEILVKRTDLKLVLDLAADQMVFRQSEWLAFKHLNDAVQLFDGEADGEAGG